MRPHCAPADVRRRFAVLAGVLLLPLLSGCTTLLLHGASDTIVDVRHSEALATALRAAGADVTLRCYEHRNHADTVASLSIPARGRTAALADIRAFVARISASPAPAGR